MPHTRTSLFVIELSMYLRVRLFQVVTLACPMLNTRLLLVVLVFASRCSCIVRGLTRCNLVTACLILQGGVPPAMPYPLIIVQLKISSKRAHRSHGTLLRAHLLIGLGRLLEGYFVHMVLCARLLGGLCVRLLAEIALVHKSLIGETNELMAREQIALKITSIHMHDAAASSYSCASLICKTMSLAVQSVIV